MCIGKNIVGRVAAVAGGGGRQNILFGEIPAVFREIGDHRAFQDGAGEDVRDSPYDETCRCRDRDGVRACFALAECF